MMASESKIGAKTATLSLRLDPKTRFILEFVARIKGQSITTVVERAIKEAADRLRIEAFDDRNNPYETTWLDFWDPSEGVRTLKLLNHREYPTTFDEDELKAFTLEHWAFFYDHPGGEPNRGFVDILWPRIDDYLDIWRKKKRTDYWAASEAMLADLDAAGVARPEWPPKHHKPARPVTPSEPNEIPF